VEQVQRGSPIEWFIKNPGVITVRDPAIADHYGPGIMVRQDKTLSGSRQVPRQTDDRDDKRSGDRHKSVFRHDNTAGLVYGRRLGAQPGGR